MSRTAADRMIPPWAMPTHQMNAPMYSPQGTPPPEPQSARWGDDQAVLELADVEEQPHADGAQRASQRREELSRLGLDRAHEDVPAHVADVGAHACSPSLLAIAPLSRTSSLRLSARPMSS